MCSWISWMVHGGVRRLGRRVMRGCVCGRALHDCFMDEKDVWPCLLVCRNVVLPPRYPYARCLGPLCPLFRTADGRLLSLLITTMSALQ